MIVIRILDSKNGNECDQEIYCNDPCYPIFEGKKYISSNPNMSTNNFNLYSDVIVDHEKYLGHYPLIAEAFLSRDYKEYCNNCMKQLNIISNN